MFLPPEVDLGHPEKYILSIRISPFDFMFSFSDAGVNAKNHCVNETSISAATSVWEHVKKVVYDYSFFALPYSRINVVLVDNTYSLIPTKYLEVQKKEELFFMTNKYKDNQTIFVNEIEQTDFCVLNAGDKNLYGFLIRNLYQPIISGHISLLLDFFRKNPGKTEKAVMYVNVHGNYLDVICMESGRLISAQTFYQLSKDDTVYFILKIWESLGWNQLTDFLYFFGDMNEDVIEILKDYLKNVGPFILPSEVFLWNKQIQSAPLDLIYLSI